MSTTAGTLSVSDYIEHHLQHLQLNVHTMTIEPSRSFWTLNLDTLIVSIIIGVIFLATFYFAARRATAGTPGKWQNFVETCVEKVDDIVKESFHGTSNLIAPLAMTIFIWVFLLNFMDLVPVDWFPRLLQLCGVEHFKVVATADPMFTFGLSIPVFILIVFYNFKSKGALGLAKEMLSRPFGWWLFPVNVAFRLVEECVKPLSLSFRLFGNLFAGELVFILIAAMIPWYIQWAPGFIWTTFHLLIILIQAFIFMMLTIVYLSMAHDTH